MLDRKNLLAFLRWILETFGAIGVFLGFEHGVSLTAAIIATTVWGLALVGWQIHRDGKASSFTLFVAASVAVFGALDLYFGATGFFVKIEPAIGNLTTGLFFLWTVIAGKPIIAEFAQRGQATPLTERALVYIRKLTIVWVLFFFVRAVLFLILALSTESVDEAMFLRVAIGYPSFLALIGGEIVYRRWRHRGRDAAEAVAPATIAVERDARTPEA